MAFDQKKLDRSVNQSRGIFNKYVYETEDTIADVQAADYFAESRFISIDGPRTNSMGWIGGIVECKCSDGYTIGQVQEDGSTLAEVIGPATFQPVAPTGGTFSAEGVDWLPTEQQTSIQLFAYDTDTTASDPGPGKIRGNNSDVSLITEIYFDAVKSTGYDFSSVVADLSGGDQFSINKYREEAKFSYFLVTGTPVDNGGWFTIPVKFISGGSGLADGDTVDVRGFFMARSAVQYISKLPPETTNSNYATSPVTFLSDGFNVSKEKEGLHQLTISFDANVSSTNRRIVVGIFIDGDLVDDEFVMEMKDPANNPYITKVLDYELLEGAHTIRVDFGVEGGGGSNVTLKNFRFSARA